MKVPLKERVRRLLSKAVGFVSRKLKARPTRPSRAGTVPYVNRIISDGILFNEIPSPTEKEALRTAFIIQRLSDFGYEPTTDDLGNVSVEVPAVEATEEHVLLFAEIGTDGYSPMESLARLETERIVGKGVAENSIGVAALVVLAEYLAANNVQFDRNATLLFSTLDLGAREAQPLECYIQTSRKRFIFGVNVRGFELGRIEERPMGTYKLTVTVRTPEREVIGKDPAASAITVLANVAQRLGGIRWDSENNTFLNVARFEAGTGFGRYAAEGMLEIEIFSSDKNALEVARNAVCATVKNLSSETGATVDISVKAFIPTADPGINTGLTDVLRGVHDRLRIKSRPTSIPDLAAVISSMGIPSVSIGITTGKKGLDEEYVDIRPLETGFRQLLAFLEESSRFGRGAPP